MIISLANLQVLIKCTKIMKKLFVLTSILIILSGCTESSSTANNSHISSSQLCEVISQQEGENIFESTFIKDPIPEPDTRTSGCKFISDENTNENKINFNIIMASYNSPEEASENYTKAINVWKNGKMPNRILQDIPGIGTKGFFSKGNNSSQLITYQNEKLLIITLSYFKEEETELITKAKQIASTTFAAINH